MYSPMPGQPKISSITSTPENMSPDPKARHGQRRGQAVAKDVPEDHGTFGQTLSAGGADVIAADPGNQG